MKSGLPAVIYEDSKVLILGTLPSDESIRFQQYYANPTNQFWRILGEVYGQEIAPEYTARLDFLRSNKLALWDVLESADRDGSTDKKIRNPVFNDLRGIVRTYTTLSKIVLNGGTAGKLFRQYLKAIPAGPSFFLRLSTLHLPSSSAAAGQYVKTLDEKIRCWKAILQMTD